MLIIYVNDMIITRNDSKEIVELKKRMFENFEMKDMENFKYFLRNEVLGSK